MARPNGYHQPDYTEVQRELDEADADVNSVYENLRTRTVAYHYIQQAHVRLMDMQQLVFTPAAHLLSITEVNNAVNRMVAIRVRMIALQLLIPNGGAAGGGAAGGGAAGGGAAGGGAAGGGAAGGGAAGGGAAGGGAAGGAAAPSRKRPFGQSSTANHALFAKSAFYSYTRNWSRDKTFDLSRAPQKGDTPMYFFLRRLGHAYESWPLFVLTGAWFINFFYACGTGFLKTEVWLDRSKDTSPSDWSRIGNDYWKRYTTHFDGSWLFGLQTDTHTRLPIMEKLQDEMLEASKKRGTCK